MSVAIEGARLWYVTRKVRCERHVDCMGGQEQWRGETSQGTGTVVLTSELLWRSREGSHHLCGAWGHHV